MLPSCEHAVSLTKFLRKYFQVRDTTLLHSHMTDPHNNESWTKR
jgi:hypothetical protein